VAERDRIAEFKEVVELMPDHAVVRFGLAGAYFAWRRTGSRAQGGIDRLAVYREPRAAAGRLDGMFTSDPPTLRRRDS
jgi:hypothetical protein